MSDDNLEILQRIFRLHIQRIPIFGINSFDIHLFEVKIKIFFTKTNLRITKLQVTIIPRHENANLNHKC